jgi:hypothetical protein
MTAVETFLGTAHSLEEAFTFLETTNITVAQPIRVQRISDGISRNQYEKFKKAVRDIYYVTEETRDSFFVYGRRSL